MRASTALACLALVPCGAAFAAVAPPGASYATNGDARLAALIAEALAANPGIRAAASRETSAREGVGIASALPDPTLQATGFALSPQTRVGPQIAGLAVTQRLPWPGKRTDRGESAAEQARIQGALAHARRADVARQVKAAYYELGYLDRAIRIADEEEQLLRHYESLARARYSQGIGLQQAVVKVQAEITRVLNRRRRFQGERAAVEAGLHALRDQQGGMAVAAVELGARPAAPVDVDALLAAARDSAPEATAAAARVAHEEVGVRLARRQYEPDVVVGAGWGVVRGRQDAAGRAQPPPDDGEDTFNVSVGVTIPVYRARLDAGVRQANARVAAAKDDYRDALNGIAGAVRAAAARLAAIDEQIDLVEKALLPQAEQALKSTEEAYATGTVDVLDLLDSEEVLLDVRLGLARLETDYMQALADMERAVGAPFPAPGGSP